MTKLVKCLCGRPLHYKDPKDRVWVENCIKRLGKNIVVNIGEGEEYLVPRHYIALHGISSHQIRRLAELGKIERVE